MGPETPISTTGLPSIKHDSAIDMLAWRQLEIYQLHPEAPGGSIYDILGPYWNLPSQGRLYGTFEPIEAEVGVRKKRGKTLILFFFWLVSIIQHYEREEPVLRQSSNTSFSL